MTLSPEARALLDAVFVDLGGDDLRYWLRQRLKMWGNDGDITELHGAVREALSYITHLEAAIAPFVEAAKLIPADVADYKIIASIPGGHHARAFGEIGTYLKAGNFRALLATGDINARRVGP